MVIMLVVPTVLNVYTLSADVVPSTRKISLWQFSGPPLLLHVVL
jgi:hypothetical protein